MLKKTMIALLMFFSFVLISCNQHDKSAHEGNKTVSENKIEEYYTCPMHPQIIQDHPGTCPICGMDLVKRSRTIGEHQGHDTTSQKIEEYYTCPMHSQIVRDRPGTCPICGMDLVKKTKAYESHETMSHPGEVNLSSDQVVALNVATASVVEEVLTNEISAYGIIEYRESSQSIISARVKGRIEKLFINSTGMTVKKGQPIFELYSPDLITTQQEYLNLLNSNQNSEYSVEVIRQRLQLWGITKEQIDEIEMNKKVFNSITIFSQYNGIVTKKSVIEGQYISEGMELFNLADLNTLWLKANIFDYELPFIKTGQNLDVISEAYPDKIFQGKISFIYPEIDQSSRTIQIKSDIINRGSFLKPGMYVKAKIKINVGKGLVVPTSAVFFNGKENLVWLQKSAGKYAPQIVILGPKVSLLQRSESFYQIREGLNIGDIVVTSSGFLIDSESRLKAAAGGGNKH